MTSSPLIKPERQGENPQIDPITETTFRGSSRYPNHMTVQFTKSTHQKSKSNENTVES